MKLTVIGSSGSFGGPGNPCSSYLVEHDGHRVLLDFGNGALGELQRYGDIYAIDAVILSHLHADHCVDMCGYYVARKYRPGGDGPLPLLPVWGPSGTRERIAQAYDTDDTECDSVFAFRDVLAGAPDGATGNTFATGPFTVRVDRVDHPVEAYAIRLEAGGSTLVYSGDTGPCAALDRIAEGADLLLAEASFQEPRDDGLLGLHLNGRQAGESAAAAGAGRLVLTHIPPWTDAGLNLAAARAAFPGPVDLAAPGAVFQI
ncbi:MBL fold metallo-hydrolase [Catenulispora yoronensis]|uniref:MBL fold metallo-hydrolase n=1 Tax=Catenulispora yoronensis TaxID=450799 RepID=A0ABN2V2C1_9ACTN